MRKYRQPLELCELEVCTHKQSTININSYMPILFGNSFKE